MTDDQSAEDAQIAEALGVPLAPQGEPVDTAPANGAEATTPPENGQHSTEDLPEWVRDELTRARREAARYRTQARDAKQTKDGSPSEDQIRSEIRREFAQEMAAARLESALTGLVDSPEEFVEMLDKSRYVTKDGNIDLDAVKALRDKFTRIVNTPSVGHGRNGTGAVRSDIDQFADVMNQLGA